MAHPRPPPTTEDPLPPAGTPTRPLAVGSAPVPDYGTGSLADLLPTLAAGLGVPGMTAGIGELTPPTATASSSSTAWAGSSSRPTRRRRRS